jgi:hypothetical protein
VSGSAKPVAGRVAQDLELDGKARACNPKHNAQKKRCQHPHEQGADRPAGAGTEVGDIATMDMLGLRSAVRKFTVTQNQAITVPTSEHQQARAVSDQRGDQQRLRRDSGARPADRSNLMEAV